MSSYKTRARDKGNINNDYVKATRSGTSVVNGSSLSASNLQANLPVKTDNALVLQSTKLEISDTNGLQTALDSAVQYQGTLPAPLGALVKISDTTGNVENSNITEADVNNKVSKSGDSMSGNLDLQTNALLNAGNVSINSDTISSTGFLEFISGGNSRINFKSDSGILSLENANLGNSVNVELSQFGGTNFNIIKQTGNVDFCAEGTDNIEMTTDCFGTNKKVILNPTTSNVQLRDYDLDLNSNNIIGVSSATIGSVNCLTMTSTDVKTNNINLLSNLDMKNNNVVNINRIDVDEIGTGLPEIKITDNLDLQTNDINNIGSMTITSTQYLSKVSDFGTPVGNYYIIPDNTTWVILGQITLQYGIEFGVNCSLRGIDFSAQITFDETSRDCDIKAVDNNFYLSQITIVNGGGRFTGNPASVRGLLNAQNYNVGAPAPFYARNKRFKLTDVNILRPFKIGTIEGFGTLNITNNFFNGGGGLASQASNYYTNEGISISDGLSLEFNNNKVVLMAGAQQASTLKMLNMKARVSSLLGINACTITGNIFHPRNAETGIDFDADSRTQLGNISGNVFIRTGGTAPLINYTDQPTFDNYNPLSIENYSINANTGVTDSEPNLKCGITESKTISSATATLLEPFDNADVKAINVSARFGIQLDLTGVSVAFVANERITDTASGNTALILAVDAEAGGLQSVYITDMSGDFSSTPSTFTSATGSATGGALRWIFRYSEKDPRKLVLSATFSVSVGSNKEYFIAPSMNGVADTLCEVGGVSTNTGAGSTLTCVCSKKYEEGDKEQFFFRTTDASAGNIEKGIIVIK
jgi:hypothetical protein